MLGVAAHVALQTILIKVETGASLGLLLARLGVR